MDLPGLRYISCLTSITADLRVPQEQRFAHDLDHAQYLVTLLAELRTSTVLLLQSLP